MSQECCAVCDGTGQFGKKACAFCNGTGEPSKVAVNYMKTHTCQCYFYDRQSCPVCANTCHHDSSQTPKQIIDPGHGGQADSVRYGVNVSEGEIRI